MTDSQAHDGGYSGDSGRRAWRRRATLLGVAGLVNACSDGVTILPGRANPSSSALVASGVVDDPGASAAPDPALPGVAPSSDPASPPVASGMDVPVAASSPASSPSNPASGGSRDEAPAATGAGGASDGPPPALRDAVALSDDDLAHQALALLGSAAVGADGSCRNCHSLGRPTLTRWQSLTNAFSAACLGDTALSGAGAVDQMLGCFHAQSGGEPAFSPSDFGIYAAAAHLPWFAYVFEHASEYADDGPAHHAQFVSGVGMPRAGSRLTQAQFDIVAEWFARGLPRLFALVPEENGGACTAGLGPELRAHVESMRTTGWKAQNEQVPLLMYGCAGGQATAECLADVPLASDAPYGEDWDVPGGAQIHILYDNTGASSNYWSRSSADGRFFASGLRPGSGSDLSGQFVDLQRGQVIEANFAYDPTFFPDNSGFMVQRAGYSESSGPTNGVADPEDTAVVCNQSLLAGNPGPFTGDEPDCTVLGGQVGLYQQLAKSTDGDDYWVVYGAFDEDNGGFSAVHENPSAAFESQSTTTLVPLINQGSGFVPGTPTRVVTPLAGDPMLSPSGRLLVTRLKGRESTIDVDGTSVVRAEQSGYALQLVTTTGSGSAPVASLSDVGRICIQGGKAVVSYDERWLVLHHYVTASDAVELGYSGPNDPAFARYLDQGASNLYLVDLLDGSTRVITHMSPGQYALYPHFRSDGWIYFVVRTLDNEEYFSATNAAVLLDSE